MFKRLFNFIRRLFAWKQLYYINSNNILPEMCIRDRVSNKHANFLINNGGATSADMIKLIELIKEKVKERFDIDLECEWVLVNF